MTQPPRLRCDDVRFAYRGDDVLHGVSLAADGGEVVGLVGPNGSGKSTLLQLAAGLLRPGAGAVAIDGDDVGQLSRREVARRIAFLPQQAELAFPFTVLEVVLSGRHPHVPWLRFESDEDRAIARDALAIVGLAELERRRFHELSGGERQRALLAAAITQQPTLLLLDEPTSALDLHYADQVMRVVHRLSAERGVTVVMAVHDLNLALAWCPRVAVLDRGRLDGDGPAAEVLTADRLRRVYGAGAEVVHGGARVAILPTGPAEARDG